MKKFDYNDLLSGNYKASTEEEAQLIEQNTIDKIDMHMDENGRIHTEAGIYIADVEKVEEETDKYFVYLTNYQGARFDSEEFESLEEAEAWSSGRGETFDFGEYHKYTVNIFKNGEMLKEYQTK